jgi:hypothetical protein
MALGLTPRPNPGMLSSVWSFRPSRAPTEAVMSDKVKLEIFTDYV